MEVYSIIISIYNVEKNRELIKRGVIAHWFFKVGKQPGIIALLNCDSMEEVRAIVNEAPTVKDNGCGFDPDIVSQGGDSFVGFGILSMRERVEICKGDFKIQSTPGKGTFIENSIPI